MRILINLHEIKLHEYGVNLGDDASDGVFHSVNTTLEDSVLTPRHVNGGGVLCWWPSRAHVILIRVIQAVIFIQNVMIWCELMQDNKKTLPVSFFQQKKSSVTMSSNLNTSKPIELRWLCLQNQTEYFFIFDWQQSGILFLVARRVPDNRRRVCVSNPTNVNLQHFEK